MYDISKTLLVGIRIFLLTIILSYGKVIYNSILSTVQHFSYLTIILTVNSILACLLILFVYNFSNYHFNILKVSIFFQIPNIIIAFELLHQNKDNKNFSEILLLSTFSFISEILIFLLIDAYKATQIIFSYNRYESIDV